MERTHSAARLRRDIAVVVPPLAINLLEDHLRDEHLCVRCVLPFKFVPHVAYARAPGGQLFEEDVGIDDEA